MFNLAPKAFEKGTLDEKLRVSILYATKLIPPLRGQYLQWSVFNLQNKFQAAQPSSVKIFV